MSYSKVNSITETLHTVKPRRVCCDINQADKINAKIRLSLAYENHVLKDWTVEQVCRVAA
jgi:hypothetical protein